MINFAKPYRVADECSEPTLSDIQDSLLLIYENYKLTEDKDIKKKLKSRWKELSSEYNNRVNFEAYSLTI